MGMRYVDLPTSVSTPFALQLVPATPVVAASPDAAAPGVKRTRTGEQIPSTEATESAAAEAVDIAESAAASPNTLRQSLSEMISGLSTPPEEM